MNPMVWGGRRAGGGEVETFRFKCAARVCVSVSVCVCRPLDEPDGPTNKMKKTGTLKNVFR